MFFSSYSEFIYVFGFTLIYNLIRIAFPSAIRVKKVFLLFGSYSILLTILDLHTLLVLTILMLGSYAVGKLMLREEIKHSTSLKVLTSSLVFIIALFCIRNYQWLGDWLIQLGFENTVKSISLVGRVGLSYILFRLLHFLVDAYRGKIYSTLNAITFLNYIFFFPTFLSGPIDRYNNFSYWEGQNRWSLNIDLMLQGVGKIFIGAVKKIMIVPFILPYVNDLSQFEMLTGIWQQQLLMTVLAYTFYIYFDFSGYSDIAIGSAYLIGIKTPENFNNPYFSRDIAEFWKKWHISFSSILTEYVFKPFVIGLSNKFPGAPRIRISVIGYLYTFIICGLWHGSTMNYVYWGLWHGIGLAIFKVWDQKNNIVLLQNKIGKRVRPALATLITFLFAAGGWYFFMTPTTEIHNTVKNEIGILNRDYRKMSSEEIQMSQSFWKGYGYGIQLEVKNEFDSPFELQYKKIDDVEWTVVSDKIPGNRKSIQIHGNEAFGGQKRNLEPGLYVVRLKEIDAEDWKGDIVQISNYKDE